MMRGLARGVVGLSLLMGGGITASGPFGGLGVQLGAGGVQLDGVGLRERGRDR